MRRLLVSEDLVECTSNRHVLGIQRSAFPSFVTAYNRPSQAPRCLKPQMLSNSLCCWPRRHSLIQYEIPHSASKDRTREKRGHMSPCYNKDSLVVHTVIIANAAGVPLLDTILADVLFVLVRKLGKTSAGIVKQSSTGSFADQELFRICFHHALRLRAFRTDPEHVKLGFSIPLAFLFLLGRLVLFGGKSRQTQRQRLSFSTRPSRRRKSRGRIVYSCRIFRGQRQQVLLARRIFVHH